MIIYPAMDLMNQNVVRLKKGDFNSKKIYQENPLIQAKTFLNQGATHLHMVDLDGAKSGNPSHLNVLQAIKKETNLSLQYGGGLRDQNQIIELLELGIDKVVLGSFAMKHPKILKELILKYPNRMVVAVDVKDNQVTYAGWQETSSNTLESYLKTLIELGVTEVLITDISKDGMLEGINVSFYKSLKTKFPSLKITASGGVTSLGDVKALKEAGLDGLIIGVALYEKIFRLEEALSC